jgi:predicted dehydrogenase
MMGNTHLDVYSGRQDVTVVAVSDKIPDRLSGKARAAGNVKGQAQGLFDMSKARKYDEGMNLIPDPEVELVDICLPTPLHVDFAIAALEQGKHVLVEKPLGRDYKAAKKLVAAAKRHPKQMTMCAMCMRFWPGWTWLRDAVRNKTYGPVMAATFRRVTNHPGGPFYSDGNACGGAALDLHIHDSDYIRHVLGTPKAVTSVGYRKATTHIDHIVTRYHFDDIPLVVAEGSWALAPGFGFQMQYTVNFAEATAVFDLMAAKPLVVYAGGQQQEIKLESATGYALEIGYFLDCLGAGKQPDVVTFADAAESVRLVEKEVQSIESGKTVRV